MATDTKTIACFESVVGIRGLCEDQDVLLYVNDLPGVEMLTFAKAATGEDITGKTTFERLRREAARQVSADFINHLQGRKNVTLIEVVSEYQSGGFHLSDSFPPQALFVGKEFYTPSGGQMIKQRVDWVEIKSSSEATTTIYIEADGVTYHKENYTLQVGINRIPIELTGDRIRVYVSIEELELFKQYSTWNGGCGGNCGGNCSCTRNSCGYEKTIKSTDGESWVSGSIDPFRYQVSCVCDTQEIVCRYKNSLADALRYKLGVLLMEEVTYSSGKSFFIRNSKANAEKWIASVMGGEDPDTGFKQQSKYWRSIAQSANSTINSLKKTPCVSCEGLSVVTSIP